MSVCVVLVQERFCDGGYEAFGYDTAEDTLSRDPYLLPFPDRPPFRALPVRHNVRRIARTDSSGCWLLERTGARSMPPEPVPPELMAAITAMLARR